MADIGTADQIAENSLTKNASVYLSKANLSKIEARKNTLGSSKSIGGEEDGSTITTPEERLIPLQTIK